MTTKFTIEDKIVGDSLASVGLYREKSKVYKPVINGGIANQLYAYSTFPDLIRPTSDLDMLVTPKLTSDGFRHDMGENIAEPLKQYNPAVDVLRHVYEVKLEDNDGDPFFIHSYKLSQNAWERRKRNIERQVSNATQLETPNSGIKVYAVRPEDIVSDKARRLKVLKDKGSMADNLNADYQTLMDKDFNSLGDQDLNEWLSLLKAQKTRLPSYYDRGPEGFKKASEEYIASKDLFDIALIAKLAMGRKIEFDEKYYDKILKGVE